ncbi:hypothetical protein L227DRAFT_297618 [Lentinus tigrinus ALCF2SS1-6]|uniref:Uncharacterized protein n=1 Tax=Lentinus tigrinus ALCF2SS1-6 TaxID=1328759 RepID=A0A5C2RXX9_9APHY|nr:hypothetical protein L227DRAFT_297618 [Lentinus tigrinus ALCF2SS1-6]
MGQTEVSAENNRTFVTFHVVPWAAHKRAQPRLCRRVSSSVSKREERNQRENKRSVVYVSPGAQLLRAPPSLTCPIPTSGPLSERCPATHPGLTIVFEVGGPPTEANRVVCTITSALLQQGRQVPHPDHGQSGSLVSYINPLVYPRLPSPPLARPPAR